MQLKGTWELPIDLKDWKSAQVFQKGDELRLELISSNADIGSSAKSTSELVVSEDFVELCDSSAAPKYWLKCNIK